MKLEKITRIIMPSMINSRGILFGGVLLSWMDELSGVAALCFFCGRAVTAAVEHMNLLAPIKAGSLLDLTAKVVSVGNSSMKVELRAEVGHADQEEKYLAAEGRFIYLAVDDQGRPRKLGKGAANF